MLDCQITWEFTIIFCFLITVSQFYTIVVFALSIDEGIQPNYTNNVEVILKIMFLICMTSKMLLIWK